MKYLFYFLAVFAIMYEVNGLFNPKEALDEKEKTIQATKKKKTLSGEQKVLLASTMCYLFWLVVGLFTFQWWAFLVLLLLGFIPKKKIWYIVFDSAISIAIILFIVINAIHFHYTPF